MRQKGFAPIILIVIIASIGAGIFFISKNINRTQSLPLDTDTSTQTSSPSSTPISEVTTTPTQTLIPTPTPSISLDLTVIPADKTLIKFGYDKGDGKGGVSGGQYYASEWAIFDEVRWSGGVAVCFDFNSNEDLAGKLIDYVIYFDNKLQNSGSLTHSYCWGFSDDVGKHTAKFIINPQKSIPETNYDNNSLEVQWYMKPDSVPPTFSFTGPVRLSQGTCVWLNSVDDNVSNYSELTIEEKLDNNSYTPYDGDNMCVNGPLGERHEYWVRITDARGNTSQHNILFSVER